MSDKFTQEAGTICVAMYPGNRLGNQLFLYASARALQIKFYPDYKIILNLSTFNNTTPERAKEGFENALKYFRVKFSGYSYKRIRDDKTFMQLFLTIVRNKLLAKIMSEEMLRRFDIAVLQNIFNKFGMYNPANASIYIKPLRSSCRKIFCSGLYENPRYFDDIRDVLLEEFTPINDPLPENLPLLDRITSSESVCVTIRRGDFLNPENATLNVCNEEYLLLQ